MRRILPFLAVIGLSAAACGEPFEIKDGDRVLFLGDTLLEREGTYGYLETRMVEQFPDRKFTVRNLAFSADTPLGWSRASFDPPAKGFERLKEQLVLVKPTVVFLGYGMAASLQEMTDRSQDWTLNRDPARYGAEPMSDARFKKELAQCMDAIEEVSTKNAKSTEPTKGADPAIEKGSARAPRAVPGASPGTPGAVEPPQRDTSSGNERKQTPDASGGAPDAAREARALPDARKSATPAVRFVLLSPIRHEDLRKERPGLPAPTEHNKLLEQYSKAIEELATERGARFVSLLGINQFSINSFPEVDRTDTDNGIHLTEDGYRRASMLILKELGIDPLKEPRAIELDESLREGAREAARREALRAAIIRKNELYFHRWRPANETYLFGFRKREQGQNAVEIPKFDPLIEAAEVEIERLKNAGSQNPPKKGAAIPSGAFDSMAAANPAGFDHSRPQNLIGSEGWETRGSQILMGSEGRESRGSQILMGSEGRESRGSQNLIGSEGLESRGSQILSGSEGRESRGSQILSGSEGRESRGSQILIGSEGRESRGSQILSGSEGRESRDSQILSGSEGRQPQHRPGAIIPAPQKPAILLAANADNTARQTPAEKPDLARLSAPFASQPHPTFTVTDGLEISLWAENPFLAKPTQMNWDAQGRLWVASSAMYPQIAPGQAAFDKIIILEDPGHTGKATKATVFVDGLLIPTGVAPVLVQGESAQSSGKSAQSSVPSDQKNTAGAPSPLSTDALSTGHSKPRWACYVGQSTELLYFEDTDGDGKADKKRIVFSGFGTEDTHHIVHTLRWGPDGRLYFNQSVYIHTHIETPWGVVRLNSGGVFAYDPLTERVEVFSKGLWNTWGHAWDKWGQSFFTDGAGFTGLTWAFPGAIFNPHEGARRTMASISPGSYPKFAGLELIYSPHFPAEWQGSAVTCDFRAHKIVHFKINDLGAEGKSGYITEQLPVLAQTGDASFRPIDVKLGPDGAIYIADWSNPIINHGEVDFRDPRRDHEHGRIWRLSMKGGAAVKWESLVGKPNTELLDKLLSENLWEKEQAKGAVVANAEKSAELRKLIEDHAWKVNHDDYLSEAFQILIRVGVRPRWFDKRLIWSKDARFRAAAMQTMSRLIECAELKKDLKESAASGDAVVSDSFLYFLPLGRKSEDEDPRVRISAMRALARIPTVETASLILDAAINAPKDDPHYEFAAWLSINDLADVWTEAVLAGKWKIEGHEKQLEFALDALDAAHSGQIIATLLKKGTLTRDGAGPWIELIGKGGGPEQLQMLYDTVMALDEKKRFDDAAAIRALDALDFAARVRNAKPGNVDPVALVNGENSSSDPNKVVRNRFSGLGSFEGNHALYAAAIRFAANYPKALQPDQVKTGPLSTLRDIAQNSFCSRELREAALVALVRVGTPEAYQQLSYALEGLDHVVSPTAETYEIRRRIVATLFGIDRTRALPVVFEQIPKLSTKENELLGLWRDMLANKDAADFLASRLPKEMRKDGATAGLRAARELGRKGQGLAAKLTPLAGETAASVIPSNYTDLAARAKKDGDPVAGEMLYRRAASACVTCHAIGGAGGKLGPDMTSIGASAPADYIIESILNPAVKVKEGYHAFSFAMKDGTEAIGIPSRETPQEQFIRTLAGEQGLPKGNIVSKKIAEGGASLMPAGLVTAWTDRERLNLYAFLMELGRPGPFDASKNNVARAWQLTVERVAPRTLPAGGETRDGAARSTEPGTTTTPALFAYTLVDGRLTKDLLAEKLAILQPKNAAVHLTARFQAASAGKAKLNLTGIRKAWLDGQPLAIASEPSPSVELTAGAHTFTVEVDAKSPPEVLRVESPAVSFLGD